MDDSKNKVLMMLYKELQDKNPKKKDLMIYSVGIIQIIGFPVCFVVKYTYKGFIFKRKGESLISNPNAMLEVFRPYRKKNYTFWKRVFSNY